MFFSVVLKAFCSKIAWLLFIYEFLCSHRGCPSLAMLTNIFLLFNWATKTVHDKTTYFIVVNAKYIKIVDKILTYKLEYDNILMI